MVYQMQQREIMKNIKVTKLALAAACACVALGANAVVIDFEEFAQPDELRGAGNAVSSKGFTFAYTPAPGEPYPVGFHFVGASWIYNVGGSTALLANSCSALTVLQSDTNTPFSLTSIDLAEVNGPGLVANVVFEATTASGQVLSHAVNVDGQAGVQRINFPQYFSNLTSVKWLQGDCYINPVHQFDNVTINESAVVEDVVVSNASISTAARSGNAYGHNKQGKNGTPPYGNAYGHDKDQKPSERAIMNPFGRN